MSLFSSVIAGLDPAIHRTLRQRETDVKPSHPAMHHGSPGLGADAPTR
ncbi:MAG: hypothetical protein OJF62_002271 [Pseudolabrys sp.]|nr:hypothetical protein [Pseudolabrys sp.]